MTEALLLAFALLAGVLMVKAPVKLALGALLAVTYLIPGDLLIPSSPSDYTTFHRVVFLLFCANILLRILSGDLDASVLRPTRLTVVVFSWVAVMFVIGVALADARVPTHVSISVWLLGVEQFLFALFVTAAIRAIGDLRWAAWLFGGVFLAIAAVAVGEHFTRKGLGYYLQGLLTGRPHFSDFNNLATRGADVRVQVGLDFSLAFAWVATTMLPLVVVLTARARSFLVRVSPGIVVLAIAWTYSRSAYLGVPLVMLVLVVAVRFDPRVLRIVIGGGVIAAVVVLLTPAVTTAFESPDVEGSTQIRQDRLPLILSDTAEAPLTGRGLGSVPLSGFGTTDSTYLLTYGETGAFGAATLGLLFVGTVAALIPGLRAPPGERLLGAAALAGVVGGIAAAAFLDEFSISGSFRTFWLIAALGGIVADRVRRAEAVSSPARPRMRLGRRALIPVGLAGAGAVAGLAVLAVTPSADVATVRIATRQVTLEAAARDATPFVNRTYVNTACQIIEARVDADPPTRGHCYDLLTDTGVADVRIEAPDRTRIERRIRAIQLVLRRYLPGYRLFRVGGESVTKPTIVETAPAWLAFVGFGIGLLVATSRPLRERVRLEGFFGEQLWPAPAR